MAKKAIFLTEDDHAILKEVINDFRTRPRNTRTPGPQFTVSGAPDVYVAKIPSTLGIPPRDGTVVGFADCDIYYTDVTTPNTPTLTVATSVSRTVFNIYPVGIYGAGTLSIYKQIQRDKFGRWLVEKPDYTLKCKPVADVPAGSTGTVKIMLAGTLSNNTLTAWNNWMNGGEQVSANKEAVIQFCEDEAAWCFVNAECE